MHSGFSSCGEWRLLSSYGARRASHCGGFSCSPQAQLLLSTWDLPGQESRCCPSHCKVDS